MSALTRRDCLTLALLPLTAPALADEAKALAAVQGLADLGIDSSILFLDKDEAPKLDENSLVVSLGGRTGRDGIHGATFSSAALEEGISSSVVQIEAHNPNGVALARSMASSMVR